MLTLLKKYILHVRFIFTAVFVLNNIKLYKICKMKYHKLQQMYINGFDKVNITQKPERTATTAAFIHYTHDSSCLHL